MNWWSRHSKRALLEISVETYQISDKQGVKYNDLLMIRKILTEVENWLLQTETPKAKDEQEPIGEYVCNGFKGTIDEKWNHLDKIVDKMSKNGNFHKCSAKVLLCFNIKF